MTPDELRALADALEPMARAPRFEDFDVPAFCEWVRACADAKPVAWRVECRWLDRSKGGDWRKYADYGTEQAASSSQQVFANPGDIESRIVPLYAHPSPQAIIDSLSAVPAGWKLVPVEPTQAMNNAGLSAVNQYGKRLVWETYKAMLAAAPQAEPSAALIRAYNSGYMQGHHDTVEAQFIVIHPLDMDTYHADVVAELGLTAAPQAEPCIGNDSACPCQDGDACHYKDAADGTKAWPVPQPEPKRDPLHGLAPTHRCPACGAFWRQCDDASWNLRSASCCGLCDAGRVELVCWLDEPKREPLSDEQIELPDYLRLQIASTAAAHDVLVERRRQVEVEGWTPEHDDAEHLPDELALAAASYICADEGDAPPAIWPWDWRWWKPSTPRRNLVKAGALILAEIERLDRMGGSDAE